MLRHCLTALALTAASLANANCAVETPMGMVFTQDNPQLEFNYLKTYDRSPKEKNAYPIEEFDQAATTYVFAKMEVENLLHNVRDQAYDLTYKYILEGEKVLGEFTLNYTIQKVWEVAWFDGKWGWDVPGNWPVGKHRVEVWIDGKRFAVREFIVADREG